MIVEQSSTANIVRPIYMTSNLHSSSTLILCVLDAITPLGHAPCSWLPLSLNEMYQTLHSQIKGLAMALARTDHPDYQMGRATSET